MDTLCTTHILKLFLWYVCQTWSHDVNIFRLPIISRSHPQKAYRRSVVVHALCLTVLEGKFDATRDIDHVAHRSNFGNDWNRPNCRIRNKLLVSGHSIVASVFFGTVFKCNGSTCAATASECRYLSVTEVHAQQLWEGQHFCLCWSENNTWMVYLRQATKRKSCRSEL